MYTYVYIYIYAVWRRPKGLYFRPRGFEPANGPPTARLAIRPSPSAIRPVAWVTPQTPRDSTLRGSCKDVCQAMARARPPARKTKRKAGMSIVIYTSVDTYGHLYADGKINHSRTMSSHLNSPWPQRGQRRSDLASRRECSLFPFPSPFPANLCGPATPPHPPSPMSAGPKILSGGP